MHYYQHNIGDYRRDTAHLTLLEHGIYRQLLDAYYLSEKPLTLNKAQLMRTQCIRTADELQAAEIILSEFFIETPDGYVHSRCEREINEYHQKSVKAANAANSRWKKDKKNRKIDNHANALQTHSERNADGMPTINHKPLTNNQEPIKKKKEESLAAARATPGLDEVAFGRWIEYRTEIKKPIRPVSLIAAAKDLAKHKNDQQAVVEQSIANGWQGLFALKAVNGKKKSSLPNVCSDPDLENIRWT